MTRFELTNINPLLSGYWADEHASIYSDRAPGKPGQLLVGRRMPSGRHTYTLNKITYDAAELQKQIKEHTAFKMQRGTHWPFATTKDASTTAGAAAIQASTTFKDAIAKRGFVLGTVTPAGELSLNTTIGFLDEPAARGAAETLAVNGRQVAVLSVVGVAEPAKVKWS